MEEASDEIAPESELKPVKKYSYARAIFQELLFVKLFSDEEKKKSVWPNGAHPFAAYRFESSVPLPERWTSELNSNEITARDLASLI